MTCRFVVGSALHFDSAASRPAAGIESFRWDFGDGSTADDPTVDHTFEETGTFKVTLTVSAGGKSDTDTATVTVLPVPAEPGLAVTVLDASSAVVAGADVLVIASDGTKHAAVTNDSGRAVLQSLPDGDYTAYAWKHGYLPATGPVNVADGSGSAELRLQPGELAATELTSKRMTYEEILAAGIDPDDPDNQNLYQFEVHLAFGPFPPVYITGIGGGGGTPGLGGGRLYWLTVGGIGVPCVGVCSVPIGSGDYQATVSMSGDNLVWMIIPGRAKWLKEFFSVQMMVTNLADPAFTLANGAATLTLPSGLSLAPTSQPQRLTQPLADIPGGQAGTASWVVRGDKEGYYDLEAHYSASLEPLGTTVLEHRSNEGPAARVGRVSTEDDRRHRRQGLPRASPTT